MKNCFRKTTVILLLISLASLLGSHATAQETVSITNPSPQEAVSNLTVVTGTVDFSEFERYELFLQGGGEMIWAGAGFTPVENGPLARLDPRVFASGTYQLVIRQVRTDSNYTDYTGPTFQIDNPLGSPVPYYPEIEPTFLFPSPERAVLRIKNCSGYDIMYDYISPMGFRSSENASLPPRREGSICPFHDAAIIPGEYQGTINEAGLDSMGYQFMAEAGKVYELTYNGREAGSFRLIIDTIEGDDPTDVMGNISMNVQTTAASGSAEERGGGTGATIGTAENVQASLPVSGQESITRTPFVFVAITLILGLFLSGFVAMRRRTVAR